MSDLNDVEFDEPDNDAGIFTTNIVFSIVLIYLIFVYQIGPRWMKNRTPFRLKNLISVYNVVQVATCLYIINRIWNLVSWDMVNVKECEYFPPGTQKRIDVKDIMYKTFLLKLVELTDTIIFVFRKKQKQISYLHTFHHSTTFILTYFIYKCSVDKGPLFPVFLNSWVHVIMYTYYFFANICSADVMKKFILIKKSITIIQMIQFCLILVQEYYVWSICKIPLIIRVYYSFMVILIFYGFYDFYKNAYTSNQENKIKNKAK